MQPVEGHLATNALQLHAITLRCSGQSVPQCAAKCRHGRVFIALQRASSNNLCNQSSEQNFVYDGVEHGVAPLNCEQSHYEI